MKLKPFGQFLAKYDRAAILEAVNGSEIMGIANAITDAIEKEHGMTGIKLIRNITTNPQVMVINHATGEDDSPGSFPDTLLKNLASNYKYYFGKAAKDIKDAEALLFEFPSYNTFIVFLAQMADGSKRSAFAVPPDYYIAQRRKRPIATAFPKITQILQKFGYKVHVQGDNEELTKDPQEMEFYNELVGVFRFASSRYFDFSSASWTTAKKELYALSQKMPEQYMNYRKRLAALYPNGVSARREMKLPGTFGVTTVSGGEMTLEEAVQKGEKIFYPNYNEFSQWTLMSMDPSTMDTAFGSGSGEKWLFTARIPGHKIIYNQKVLPTGLTQLKVEGEMIVDHNPGQPAGSLPKIDKEIICTVTPPENFNWTQDMEESIRRFARLMRD